MRVNCVSGIVEETGDATRNIVPCLREAYIIVREIDNK